ncbi:hydrolase, TatD family [Shuttleworthella sp. MSX8B]|uniref:TatD family hydrolase n=1 Tax=Shuttleworthella sp. MSX8B TaxID=936574 RepID=UPI00044F243A|nr:TatD family hydrolase [Shuttleworthia sp. MSX8B]EUB19040.1 hydrolase, TatD family [Shuttleworthia sp. MSX8B]
MIFETHAHLDGEEFDQDREEVLARVREAGISHLVNIGSDIKSSRRSLALAHRYDWIYAAVGVHPEEIRDFYPTRDRQTQEQPDWEDRSYGEQVMREIRQLAQEDKVVAVGEIGLDYYWVKDPKERKAQIYWFQRQLALAGELGLPVVIHSRDAAKDTMEIMREAAKEGIRGVIHCYSYSKEQALEYVRLGFFIGVGGVVTFKNGRKLREAVEAIPIRSLVLETDSPYMSPEPRRGRRNDPRNLRYIAGRIAEIRGISYDEVVSITEENAMRLYPEVRDGRIG